MLYFFSSAVQTCMIYWRLSAGPRPHHSLRKLKRASPCFFWEIYSFGDVISLRRHLQVAEPNASDNFTPQPSPFVHLRGIEFNTFCDAHNKLQSESFRREREKENVIQTSILIRQCLQIENNNARWLNGVTNIYFFSSLHPI